MQQRADGAAITLATLLQAPAIRYKVAAFLRPVDFLHLRAVHRATAAALVLQFGPSAIEQHYHPVSPHLVAPARGAAWLESATLIIDAFPDTADFLSWFILSRGAWSCWRSMFPPCADALFRPQVEWLVVSDARCFAQFRAGRAWAAEFLERGAEAMAAGADHPDGTNSGERFHSNHTFVTIRRNNLPDGQEIVLDGLTTSATVLTRPINVTTTSFYVLWNLIRNCGGAQWIVRLDIRNSPSRLLDSDLRPFVRLEHIRLTGANNVESSARAGGVFHPPPNLRSLHIESEHPSTILSKSVRTRRAIQCVAAALLGAAATAPHIEELGVFVLDAETRACAIAPGVKRLRLWIDDARVLWPDSPIRNALLADPGAFFVPPGVEELHITVAPEMPDALALAALPVALRVLTIVGDDCRFRDAPPSLQTLVCLRPPDNLAALGRLRALTLTAPDTREAGLCLPSSLETLDVRGILDAAPPCLATSRLRTLRLRRWNGPPLAPGTLPPTLEELDVHCVHECASFLTRGGPPFLGARDALPPSLRVLRVTGDSYYADPMGVTFPAPCPMLTVATIGTDFAAWEDVPPSVCVLIFTRAVPPSFWASGLFAQLSGALVYRDTSTITTNESRLPSYLGDPDPLPKMSHMWWRRMHRNNRWIEHDSTN